MGPDRVFADEITAELAEHLDDAAGMAEHDPLMRDSGLALDIANFAREIRRWRAQHL